MKNIILLATLILGISIAQAQERTSFEGFESEMNYVDIEEAQKHFIEFPTVLGHPLAFKEDGQILYVPMMKQTRDLSTGEVKDYYSDYPLRLYEVDWMTEYELPLPKAIIEEIKEKRDRIFEINENTVELPFDKLKLKTDELIAFKCTEKEAINIYRELKLIDARLHKKALKIVNARKKSVSKRIHDSLTEEEKLILECCHLKMIFIDTKDNAKSDVEFGCKNLYLKADRMFILAPEYLKKRKHELWEKSSRTSDYFKMPKTSKKTTQPPVLDPQLKPNPRSAPPKPKQKTTYQHQKCNNPNCTKCNPKQQKKYVLGKVYWENERCYYIADKGDYFYKIARKVGVEAKVLMSLNKGIDYEEIDVGQKIRIK